MNDTSMTIILCLFIIALVVFAIHPSELSQQTRVVNLLTADVEEQTLNLNRMVEEGKPAEAIELQKGVLEGLCKQLEEEAVKLRILMLRKEAKRW